MRSLIVFGGLLFAVAAIAADKSAVVAAVTLKAAAPSARPSAVPAVKVMVTKETAIPEGSLEMFSSVGLPQ